MTQPIRMNFEGNRGYGPDQVQSMTLGDLAAAVEQALATYGEDAQVVLHQTNNGYGANFGQLDPWNLFDSIEDDDDDDEDF